jgi:hypothetical protein
MSGSARPHAKDKPPSPITGVNQANDKNLSGGADIQIFQSQG